MTTDTSTTELTVDFTSLVDEPVGATITETTDAPADTTTPYRIGDGDRFSGSIGSATDLDQDWVAVTLETGFDYIFTLQNDPSSVPTSGYKLELRRPDLAFPRGEDTAPPDTPAVILYNVDFVFGEPGEHFLTVQGTTGTGSFDYHLTVQQDIGQSLNTRAVLDVGGSQSDAIDAFNDRDWFSSSLGTGSTYAYVLRTTDPTTDDQRMELELRTDEGNTVARGTTYGSELVILTYDPSEPGDFFVEAESFRGDYFGGYTIELIEEVSASTSTSAALAPGGTYVGNFDYRGDTDWIGIELTAGQMYDLTFELTGATGPAIPRLRLLDDTGGFIADTGLIETPADGTLTYTPTASGQYYLQVYTSSPDLLGEYTVSATASVAPIEGTPGNDVLTGTAAADTIDALGGDDTLRGLEGDDLLNAGDGTDTINGGPGNDTITGGETASDRRDTIFGGDGNDSIDAGHGNDLVYGQNGNDTIAGGFGADELFGQNGDDVITGSAFSDLVFGGAGDDFVNGGFGFDRINGGTGADKFFHAAADGHGSDWLQDYSAAEGDVLVFGGSGASASDFVVRFAHTATPAGERSGNDDVQEAFVNFRGQTLWALVDGGGQEAINIQIGGDTFDVLA